MDRIAGCMAVIERLGKLCPNDLRVTLLDAVITWVAPDQQAPLSCRIGCLKGAACCVHCKEMSYGITLHAAFGRTRQVLVGMSGCCFVFPRCLLLSITMRGHLLLC